MNEVYVWEKTECVVCDLVYGLGVSFLSLMCKHS